MLLLTLFVSHGVVQGRELAKMRFLNFHIFKSKAVIRRSASSPNFYSHFTFWATLGLFCILNFIWKICNVFKISITLVVQSQFPLGINTPNSFSRTFKIYVTFHSDYLLTYSYDSLLLDGRYVLIYFLASPFPKMRVSFSIPWKNLPITPMGEKANKKSSSIVLEEV